MKENMTDIVQIASQQTSLRRRRHTFWGRCPIGVQHGDADSFSVNEREQLFYCFACRKGGNAEELIQALEN